MLHLSDLREGDHVSEIYLCKTKSTAKTKTGKNYYSLSLQDSSGIVDGKIWDLSSGIDHFEAMDYIAIEAEAVLYQNQVQLNIRRVRKAHESEYDPADYLPSSPYNEDEMMKKLRMFIDSVKNPYLSKLLHAFFDDAGFEKTFRKHSAAKHVHHSFVNGLLQHTLRVTELCDFYCQRYDALQRDLLITGAILHDIGKIKELSTFPENDYTNDGNLLGHIAMGYEMVMSKTKEIEGFPERLAGLVGHLILSHHGELDYGSPKKPAFIEAVALHYADNTDAKIQTMTEMINGAETDGWLGYKGVMESNICKIPDINKM